MDDSEVVRVLAEFMGLKKCRCSVFCISWVDESGKVDANPETYLTDYNAIADVWRRIWENEPETEDKPVPKTIVNLAKRPWFNATPRDQAHALAKAILEAKQ